MSVHPNLYHLIAISTLTFCVLTLSTNVAQGQGFTSDADGLFNIRGIQETGGGSDTQFNSTTEVLNIWNAIDGGATVPGTVSANSQTYDIGDFEVDKETVVNYNGGDFGGNLSYATINSDGAPGGAGGSIGTGAGGTEDFSVRADASVAIPVGTWSIAISSDDGRYLVLTGANFTATGGEDAPDLGGVGMDFFGFDGTSGHDSTIGVFTVAPSDTVKGGSGGSIDSGLAIRTLDAFFFERGGGDSVEIAIKSGSDTSGAASPAMAGHYCKMVP